MSSMSQGRHRDGDREEKSHERLGASNRYQYHMTEHPSRSSFSLRARQPFTKHHVEVPKMPILMSFTAGAVREFLQAEEEYQWYRTSLSAEPVPLRSMISSKILYALPRIIKSLGLEWHPEWSMAEEASVRAGPWKESHKLPGSKPAQIKTESRQQVLIEGIQRAVGETLARLPVQVPQPANFKPDKVTPEVTDLLRRLTEEIGEGREQLRALEITKNVLAGKVAAGKGEVAVSDTKAKRAELAIVASQFEQANVEYTAKLSEITTKEALKAEMQTVIRVIEVRREANASLDQEEGQAHAPTAQGPTIIPMVFPIPTSEEAEYNLGDTEPPSRINIQWEKTVRKALRDIAGVDRSIENTKWPDVERLIRSEVRWDSHQESFKDSWRLFVESWERVIHEHGIRRFVLESSKTQRRVIKILAQQLYPDDFRKDVLEAIEYRDPKNVDTWIDELLAEERPYNALMASVKRREASKRTDTSSHRASRVSVDDNRHSSAHSKRTHDYSRSKSPAERSDRRVTFGLSTTPFRSSNRSERPYHTKPQDKIHSKAGPRGGCLKCKGDHWLSACPPATEADRHLLRKAYKGNHTHRVVECVYTAEKDKDPDGKIEFQPSGQGISFKLDSGPSRTFLNADQARELVEAGTAKRYELHRPMQVRTAVGGSAGVLEVSFRITAPARFRFRLGVAAFVPALELYAVEGLERDEILVSKETMASMGLDLDEMILSTFPMDDAGTVSMEDDFNSGFSEKDEIAQRISEKEEEEQQLPPEIDDHDPVVVQEVLEKVILAAAEEGLSVTAIQQLRQAIQTELADAFRLKLTGDPPAKVKPIKVTVLPSVYSVKQGCRKYSKQDSEFMDILMRKLRRLNLVYENTETVVTSPAYPVKKA
jgi:hypothetical protein